MGILQKIDVAVSGNNTLTFDLTQAGCAGILITDYHANAALTTKIVSATNKAATLSYPLLQYQTGTTQGEDKCHFGFPFAWDILSIAITGSGNHRLRILCVNEYIRPHGHVPLWVFNSTLAASTSQNVYTSVIAPLIVTCDVYIDTNKATSLLVGRKTLSASVQNVPFGGTSSATGAQVIAQLSDLQGEVTMQIQNNDGASAASIAAQCWGYLSQTLD